ncbi:MAG: NFACT family protein [Oscillospiraceae bacterium]|jgi:predicted ribosome quality control (RQC) complex YloA/Tae2 family protein|nr:NFACT family protein [Oscillospiraceae bacterium]
MNYSLLSAVKDELKAKIVGSRIDKIRQPERDLIILSLRGQTGVLKLLISVSTSDTRVHLTTGEFENPKSPPMFCMLLRKHLQNAKISDIFQPEGERVLYIILKTSSALGEPSNKQLILEMFGRKPNIILTDSDGIIIDCLRRISGDMLGNRMLLPGLKYQEPPAANKQLTDEIINDKHETNNISATLDTKFTNDGKDERMRQRSSNLSKTMKTAQKRVIRRIEAQKKELDDTSRRDYYRECGDILTANMHLIKKGDTILIADDFYSKDGKIKREISIDPLKSPQQNAARYYKLYTKARNASNILVEHIKNGENELHYIESVIEQISRAKSEEELEDIRNELSQTGYIKAFKLNKTKHNKQKHTELKPLVFTSTNGIKILVGRNNIQNDKLTFKIASRSDIWLHTQKIHGAHVIIQADGREVDDITLKEAAEIAAYYSAGKNDKKVQVDYTMLKNVKKPTGARPGMVIYTDYKTIMVKPREMNIQ